SYRGYGAGAARDALLMLNMPAKTSVQHACVVTAEGDTLATGSITSPIRSCSPRVAVSACAVHVLAVGGIREPGEAWRADKKEQTGQTWDYVFRIWYYAYTPDLTKGDVRAPIEIANVDATGGHISNKDLYADAKGDVYLMYTAREVASPLLRDKFF